MRIKDTDKRELIQTEAIKMIIKDGLEGFSMNKLAKACKISVATPYIYYKDRDDLILTIAKEVGQKMSDAILKDFDPDAHFEEGLRVQWKNRYSYITTNQDKHLFFEQLRNSSYQEEFLHHFLRGFKEILGRFLENAVKRGELDQMPFEVYWSVAFSPMYSLARFHNEGKSLGGKVFKMTDEILWQTFDLVVKALKKT
ncbi:MULTISPECIES: TetR/AcrR family transcriptional regulator [Chryseobacterium]|uniref:TetR/AcrR family transcriptional regulator n=1 Tax=Chryseobacterium TaxID=59732 RepID=UPI001BEA6A7F|nr:MULTISPECIES: TetR/AcrR family transcriptional regulator [Chryseobacterium]MBT2619896.1 TetR/AcrR family transcriptional regulator [Chryseobacterium sp. ISL-6]